MMAFDLVVRNAQLASIPKGAPLQDIGISDGKIAAVAPASMIFIPCVDGISHNESEEISPEWSTAGGQVLLGALLELAKKNADRDPDTALQRYADPIAISTASCPRRRASINADAKPVGD